MRHRAFINHRCPGAARGSAPRTLLPCEGEQQSRKGDLQPCPSSPGEEGHGQGNEKMRQRQQQDLPLLEVVSKRCNRSSTGSALGELTFVSVSWTHI